MDATIAGASWEPTPIRSVGHAKTEAHSCLQDRRAEEGDAIQQQQQQTGIQQQAQGQEEGQVKGQPSSMQSESIKRGVRKRILGYLNEAIHEIESRPVEQQEVIHNSFDAYHVRLIGEVFSVPRFSARAYQHGLQPGRSFDLELGDNFLNPTERQKCIQHLRERRYGLVTMFSNLQFLAQGRSRESCRQDPVFQKKYKEALTLLHFGIAICHLQMSQGNHFLFEQPWSASSWKQEPVRKLLNTPTVQLVRTDQCAFGQADLNGDPIRKRTGFATNCAEIAQKLRRQCSGRHRHVPCIGVCRGKARATQASKYTRQLVHAVLRGYVQHLKNQHAHTGQLQLSTLYMDHATQEIMRCEYNWDNDQSSHTPLQLFHVDLWSNDEEIPQSSEPSEEALKR